MTAIRFEYTSHFTASTATLWRFHVSPDALQSLSPRLMNFHILDPGKGIAEGSLVKARCGWWPLRFEWHALHAAVQQGREFTDVAVKSPFPYWVHHHRIAPHPEGGSTLSDVIWFTPPRGIPRALALGPLRLALTALFWWRHRVTRDTVERRRRSGNQSSAASPLTSCEDHGG